MKLIFTINNIKNCGPYNVIENIVNNLDEKKYKIIIVSLFGKDDKKVIDRIKNKNVSFKTLNLSRKKFLLNATKKFNQFIKSERPDIIHSHGILPDFLLSKTNYKCNKVTTIHNNMFEDYLYTYGKLKSKILTFLHIHCIKKLTNIVCCSKSVYDSLATLISNITYVRNGVSQNEYDSDKINKVRTEVRKELNLVDNQKLYVYVGAMTDRKNVLKMATEFIKYKEKNEKLLLLGNGPQLSKIKDLNCEDIIILGFVDKIDKYLIASDIYISFSKSEGLSISIIEALGFGKYLLLSNIKSHKEFFEINKNYYVGETFAEEKFSRIKEKLKFKMLDNNNKNIINFKEKYLSGKVMAFGYDQIYSNFEK